MKIELRPCKFKVKPTLIRQINKCEEEHQEFKRAILKGDIDNAIEEFYDDIQVKINTLRMLDIPLEIIVNGQSKHFSKLVKRGWSFEEDIQN